MFWIFIALALAITCIVLLRLFKPPKVLRPLHELLPHEKLVHNLASHVSAEVLHPWLQESATSLARRIKNGELTSAQLVDCCIEHILAVNPHLNAAVGYRFESAREEAREADQLLARTPKARMASLPPFLGVPCSVKECYALTGMPQTGGLAALADHVADCDATVVARMRAAGLIPLGVSNVSEMCMWMESNNKLYGRSHNPYHLARTVGGSSGGEAALIAACGVPSGLGSDVGGSIRMPAFFNGIYGHKPSAGTVPNTGGLPLCKGLIQRYCQPGPLCRHVEDLYPMLKVMSGADGQDTECVDFPISDPASIVTSSIRVFRLDCRASIGSNLLLTPLEPQVEQAQRRAAEALKAVGCEVHDLVIPEFKEAFDIWSSMMSAAQSQPFRRLIGQPGCGAVVELCKLALGLHSDHTLPALLLSIVERGNECLSGRTQRFVQQGVRLRAKLNAMLGPNDVMLVPPHPRVAPAHDWSMLKFQNFIYTGIFNVMELPVTAVPLGLSQEGLPLGVQVVAAYQRDHVSIAAAHVLDRAFGGWKHPQPLSSS